MANLAQIQSIAQGQFFVKDSLGNLTELKVGDTVSLNDTIVAASSNTDLSKIEILFDTNELIILSQGEQLLDATLLASTFGNEELAFDKQEVDETLNAWNNAQDGDATDMETAAGDVTEQATNAGDERAADGGALRSKFNSRDGDATDIVSDLREASWTGGIERTIEDSENMLLEDPLPVVYTIIEGINVVNEGDSANYVVKLQDAAGNPVIATQDTIIYVRYTNKTTQDGDTQYNNENIIEVVIKAGTSQTEFTIKTNDDYLADNGEIYNVSITGNNSTEFDMRTGDVAGNKTNVDTTILDNSNPLNPGGEDGGYGSEDTVFAIIEGTTAVKEGDTAQYVVKLVDKDGNPVTVTKDTEVTIKYTNKTTQDGDTQYKDNDTIKITIKAGENSSDKFDVDTIDDYLADNGEKFNLEITNVDDQGQFEKVDIGDINDDKKNVDTTILDNTTDKPNENSTVETTQENVILKIVAVDKDGNPIIKDGKYTFENDVAEGSNAKYMVLAFKPGTTEFKTTDVVDTQGGTVTIKTTDYTAKTTGTKDNAELDYKSETSKTVTLGEVFEIKTLDDYLADDGEKYTVSINDKTYTHPTTGAIYENVVTNTDPVTTTIKDNTTPNTETNVEDVKIVLVAVNSSTTTIADITDTTTGKLIIDNTNETPESGKLYYIAVAVDKDGKPLATQDGNVTINYGTTPNTSDKDATAGTDYDNTTKVNTKVGVVFEVKTNDDYYAEGDENFTVRITDLKNSPYETPSIDTNNDTVISTIKDNIAKINQADTNTGEDTAGNTYGVEDTVYAIITGETTVNEGGEVTYTVKLVDKAGNTVIPTKETTVTVTYTNIGTTSTDDTNNTNNQEIAVKIDASGKGTFTVETKDDYYAEADENYNVKITNVQNTGEFENVKFDSYPNTIPNNPSNNVTTTIVDNVATNNHEVDSDGGVDGTVYGKEDTVYVRIIQDSQTIEGGNLNHKIQLVDKVGNPVEIPAGEKITVKLQYTPLDGTDVNNSDFVNSREVEVTLDNSVKENGYYKVQIQNQTKVDFDTEGTEKYKLKIIGVSQEKNTYENITIDSKNSVTGTILDGITFEGPVDSKVDEDNFFKSISGTGQNVTKQSLTASKTLVKVPDEYENQVGKYTIDFVGVPTVTIPNNDGSGKEEYPLKSNGQDITYSVNGNTIIATREDGKKVFEIVLDKATGKYNYTQSENIDHPSAGDVSNAAGIKEFNTLDDIFLNFQFKITTKDSDGNIIGESGNQSFNVTVNDSSPIAGERKVTLNEDTKDFKIVLSDEPFSENGTIIIDNGKDGEQIIAEKGIVNIYDGDRIIGTLTNNGDGTLTFKPNEHYSKYSSDDLPNFKYIVKDTDGDFTKGQINIHVKPVTDGTEIKFQDGIIVDKNGNGTITTFEDTKNTAEGKDSVSLGLKIPTIKDNTDNNDSAKGDHGERVGELTLTFRNADKVVGTKLLDKDGNPIKYKDGTEVVISSKNQVVKIVIVNEDGTLNKDFHTSDVHMNDSKTVYMTKEQYESMKINHAEDNDTDIQIRISTKTWEVDDDGKKLLNSEANGQGKTDYKDMKVIVKPVTDDIEIHFDNTKVNGSDIGTIENGGKTFVFNDVKEGEFNFKINDILSNTSGTSKEDGHQGKGGDLDGSERRTYTISDIPAGTVIILDGNSYTVQDGKTSIEIPFPSNTKADPNFSMKFPENYSGRVEGKITLSVYDNGVDGYRDTTNYGNGKNGIKTAEVDFKVNVNPVADDATIKVGQSIGYEDAGRNTDKNVQDKDGTIKHPENGIALDIRVSSTDTDGSEKFELKIKNIPNGGALFIKDPITGKDVLVSFDNDGKPTLEVWNADGTKSAYTDGNIIANKGDVTITPPTSNSVDISGNTNDNQPVIKFIPPHNAHGDFKLGVEAKTVDTVKINGVDKTHTQEVATSKEIVVVVKDVADSVVGNEYNKINLVDEKIDGVANPNYDSKYKGTKKDYNAVVNEDDNGGKISLNSIFTVSTELSSYDKESEDLTIIIRDLPIDVTLTGNVTLINGQYIFKADDISGIKIVTPPNYSGELNFKIDYITTEAGKETNNPSKTFDSKKSTDDISIFVKPIVDAEFKSNTITNEDSESVKDGNSYYKLDLRIEYKNGDIDETLVSVKLDKPADGEFKLFIKNSDGSFTEITEFNKVYIATELGNIYVQAPENKHGEFKITGKYTVKDSQNGVGKNINYEATEEKGFDHTLTIKPVTDTPIITVNPKTDTSITVKAGEEIEIKIPVKVSSGDKDGSENITKIVISGVPKGVTIDLGAVEKDGKITISEHNGIYTIVPKDGNYKLNDDDFKNIIFNIGKDANFEHRDITITAYTKDAEGSEEESTSTVITLDKEHTGTGGEGLKIDIELKDNGNFKATEDTEFNFLDIFQVVAVEGKDGRTEINFKIDVGENAGLKGLEKYKQADGSYKIVGNRADIESVLANLKVVPNKDYNDNHTTDKGTLDITVTIDGKTPVIAKVPVTPVTDSLNVEITANDSTTIDENGEFNFDIKLTNNSDKEFTKINDFYVVVNEKFETGETSKGELYLGNTKLELVDGKYKLPADYKLGESLNLTYKSGEDRHGAVEIKVIAKNNETGATNELSSAGSTTITVKPVVSSVIEVQKVQDGIEDQEMASAKLNVVKADLSEKFESVLIKVDSGVAVYYNGGNSLAMNVGDGSWIVPVNSDGTLPQIFFKGNEHFGGKIKFDAIINVKDGNSKSTIEIKDSSVYIKEVADGVTIDPTKTGIDAKGFEWTSLNLNANMKDLDGSEKMHFTLVGLDSSAQFRVNNGDGTYTDLSSKKASQDATGKWTINGIEAKDINSIEISHDKSVKDVEVKAWTVDGNNVSTSDPVTGTFDLSYKADAKFDNGVFTFTLAKDMDIDFNNIGKLGFTNVEKIDLGASNGKNELLNLTLDDVLAIGKKDANGNINLDILGGTDDKVSFAKDNGWELKTENKGKVEGDKTFDVYTNSGDPTVQVKVEEKISDGITS